MALRHQGNTNIPSSCKQDKTNLSLIPSVHKERVSGMETPHTTPDTLEATIAALEQEWERTEQVLRDADLALEQAQANHKAITSSVHAQRQNLETRLTEARAALERRNAARAKAQRVIQETLTRATLEAILWARIEEACSDLDKASIEAMVTDALETFHRTTSSPTLNPILPQTSHDTHQTRTDTNSYDPVPHTLKKDQKPNLDPLPNNTTIPQPTVEQMMETNPDIRGETSAKDTPTPPASTPKPKTAAAKSILEMGRTRILTFDEDVVLGARPGWTGNPFKR
jgi:hypothetical protein